jgi:hypothetical protein
VLQAIALLLLLLLWFYCSHLPLHCCAVITTSCQIAADHTVIGAAAAAVAAAAGLLQDDAAWVCCQLSQEGLNAASQQALQTPDTMNSMITPQSSKSGAYSSCSCHTGARVHNSTVLWVAAVCIISHAGGQQQTCPSRQPSY